MRYERAIGTLLLLIAPSVCAGFTPYGLDVNDVSFLVPTTTTSEHGTRLNPELGLSDLGIFDPALLGQVVSFIDKAKTGHLKPILFNRALFTNVSAWKIVSVRYEHCGDEFHRDPAIPATLLKGAACSERLRVVAQPNQPEFGPFDSALHLLYRLGPEPVGMTPAIHDLLELKRLAQGMGVETSGLPLLPHPALALSGTDSGPTKFELAFVDFLKRQIKPQRLELLTVIAKVAGPGWKFVGGTVDHGQWSPFNTPVLEGLQEVTPEEIKCDMITGACEVFPGLLESTQTVNLTAQAKLAGIDGSPQVRRTAEIIDDPRQSGLFNTSCVSCHISKSFRDPDGFQLLFPEDLNGVTAFVEGDFMLGHKGRVLNFGYNVDGAQVSGRTVMESAEVAGFVNRLIGARNPGLFCEAPQRDSLWACLTRLDADVQSCLASTSCRIQGGAGP